MDSLTNPRSKYVKFRTYFKARRSRDLRSLDVWRALSRCYVKETLSTLAPIIIAVASTLVNDPDCSNKEERKLNAICKEINI